MLNYFSAENLHLKRPWLLGSSMIMLNLLNMMAWSQHYFIHVSFYIFLLSLIARSILKDKTDDRLLLGLFLFGCLWVLTEPVADWDARSIWFFHAKRIFIDSHLYAQLDNYAPWSHNDYPPLLPALGASIAKSFGFWNEYLPRISILLALFPILLISKRLFNNQVAFNLWALGLLIVCKTSLINGYMDSLLAIYIASGCLLITKIYSNTKNKFQYYFPLILVLASLPLIKNEGILATLIFILLLIPRFNKETIYIAFSILSISIYLLFWKYPLILNNIHSDLFSSDVFSIITKRMHNPQDIILVVKKIFMKLWIFLLISLGLLVKYKKIEKVTLIFAFFIFIYLAGIFIIYMITPHDLGWHLNTSISRTLLPIKISILTALIYVIFLNKSP